MEVAGACCHAGEERKVAVPIGNDAEVEPCVIAVDDSSVDRAIVTALLRRSKYRGEDSARDASRLFSFDSFFVSSYKMN
jgi:hypothetical protein